MERFGKLLKNIIYWLPNILMLLLIIAQYYIKNINNFEFLTLLFLFIIVTGIVNIYPILKIISEELMDISKNQIIEKLLNKQKKGE